MEYEIMFKSFLAVIVLFVCSLPGLAQTTYFVRSYGGTRAVCDGKADAAPVGTATNQHCALGDYRSLYDEQSGNPYKWVFAGGDIVNIGAGQWRVGLNQGISPVDPWNTQGLGQKASESPVIPSGTATQHTKILGENFAACSATNKTQLFGGFGLYHVLHLGGTAFVDVECIEITRHSQCVQHGWPIVGTQCNNDYPFDDFATDGITTDQGTHDVLLQDVWIHNLVDRGILGPIGGAVTCLRCDIAFNGMAGWDFDDGSGNGISGDPHEFGLPSINNATWNFLYSTLEWNGCIETYPATGIALACYDQDHGGYGDAVGAPPGTALNINFDHSSSHNNTQDGIDPGHIDTGASTLTVTNSSFFANMGQQLKWGYNFTKATVSNNLVIGNCYRNSAPVAGMPVTFNQNLDQWCRAYSALSWNYRDGENVDFTHNTIVGYAPVTFVLGCSTLGGCPHSVTNFTNNIIRGYDNPITYNNGGQGGGPGTIYCQDNVTGGTQVNCLQMGVINRANNTWFGTQGIALLATELNTDPAFVNEPPTFVNEVTLDNYNAVLTTNSLSAGQGEVGVFLPVSGIPSGPVVTPPPPTVVPVAPVISWATPATVAFGTALSGLQLNATANTPGTFVYTPGAGTVPAVGTDTLSVVFTPTDLVDFTKATASVKLVVFQPVKSVPTIIWANPSNIKVGTALSSNQLNATASVSGKFVYTPALGTVLPQGTNILSVTFTPTDTINYTAAAKSVQIVVTGSLPCSGSVSYSISVTGVMSLGTPSACR
jgi:hypothetical protein